LNPPNKAKQQIMTLPADLAPVVGVSIVLRKEDMVNRSIEIFKKQKLNS